MKCTIVRYVSHTNGTNNSSCLYSEDPMAHPCKNLRYALVEKESFATLPDYCNTPTGPDVPCVYLYNGTHYLTGETQVTNVNNVLIKGLSTGEAIVRCRSFPNNDPDQWDHLTFLCSQNVTVMGLVFERCGPFASGIFTAAVLTSGLAAA